MADNQGQGDNQSPPLNHAIGLNLPRSPGQVSLLTTTDEHEQTETDSITSVATLTSINSSFDSILTDPFLPLSTSGTPVDPLVYQVEIMHIRAECMRFMHNQGSNSISFSLAQQILVYALHSMHHHDPVGSANSIVSTLNVAQRLPANNEEEFIESILTIVQATSAFDQARLDHAASLLTLIINT